MGGYRYNTRASDGGRPSISTSREAYVAAKSPTPQHTLTIERVVSNDGTLTLVCRGHIVVETADRLKSEVKSLAPQHKCIQADLSSVPYVDNSGLGTVLATYMSAKHAGCELKLINVHPNVRDLLNVTRLTSVFEGSGQ